MAKYEKTFTGNFDQILSKLHNGILNGSFSASYEDGSDYLSGTTRCAIGFMSGTALWAVTV